MADCAVRWRRSGSYPTLAGLVLAAALGCNRGSAPPTQADTQPAPEPPPTARDTVAQVPIDPRLNQSFADATRQDPPPSAPRPPDTTLTKRSVGKLYTEVLRLWKEIPFATADGKRIDYSATLETDLGPIEMALLSDAAPNHVRNFVALARAGYYDGLQFDHIIHATSDIEEFKGQVLDTVEAGGPLGAEDLEDHDGIGYWLKPEIDAKLRHEEGTVGALRGEEMDSASCRFYIMVGRSPTAGGRSPMDGNYTIFGKVTRGLDVARKIHQQPLVELEPELGYSRPEKPVTIQKVTIHTRELDNPGAAGENK
jgi:peptidyl-prolyl cis-trans isomerase B (cyclophilin B)